MSLIPKDVVEHCIMKFVPFNVARFYRGRYSEYDQREGRDEEVFLQLLTAIGSDDVDLFALVSSSRNISLFTFMISLVCNIMVDEAVENPPRSVLIDLLIRTPRPWGDDEEIISECLRFPADVDEPDLFLALNWSLRRAFLVEPWRGLDPVVGVIDAADKALAVGDDSVNFKLLHRRITTLVVLDKIQDRLGRCVKPFMRSSQSKDRLIEQQEELISMIWEGKDGNPRKTSERVASLGKKAYPVLSSKDPHLTTEQVYQRRMFGLDWAYLWYQRLHQPKYYAEVLQVIPDIEVLGETLEILGKSLVCPERWIDALIEEVDKNGDFDYVEVFLGLPEILNRSDGVEFDKTGPGPRFHEKTQRRLARRVIEWLNTRVGSSSKVLSDHLEEYRGILSGWI